MNREIKFRAYNKGKKEMIYFNIQDFVNDQNYEYGDCAIPSPEEGWMQYTGLKDINGEEIYEGDILCTSEIYESGRDILDCVKWDVQEEHLHDGWFTRGGFIGFPLVIEGFHLSELYIIGNIYENPELLDKKL